MAQPSGQWTPLDRKIYAYSKYDGSRDPSKDFHQPNQVGKRGSQPRGIFTNGSIMWVSDDRDKKIYAYDATGNHSRSSNNDFNNLGSEGNATNHGAFGQMAP